MKINRVVLLRTLVLCLILASGLATYMFAVANSFLGIKLFLAIAGWLLTDFVVSLMIEEHKKEESDRRE